jgi:hypothetical protein
LPASSPGGLSLFPGFTFSSLLTARIVSMDNHNSICRVLSKCWALWYVFYAQHFPVESSQPLWEVPIITILQMVCLCQIVRS